MAGDSDSSGIIVMASYHFHSLDVFLFLDMSGNYLHLDLWSIIALFYMTLGLIQIMALSSFLRHPSSFRKMKGIPLVITACGSQHLVLIQIQ